MPALQGRKIGASFDARVVILAQRERPARKYPAQGSTRFGQPPLLDALIDALGVTRSPRSTGTAAVAVRSSGSPARSIWGPAAELIQRLTGSGQQERDQLVETLEDPPLLGRTIRAVMVTDSVL